MCADVEELDSIGIDDSIDNTDIAGYRESSKTFLRSFERMIAKEGMIGIVDKHLNSVLSFCNKFWVKGDAFFEVCFEAWMSVNSHDCRSFMSVSTEVNDLVLTRPESISRIILS